MKKKRIIAILIGVLALFGMFVPSEAYADGGCNMDSGHFLGLRAWYDGLAKDNNCTIKSPRGDSETRVFVWTIVLNVVSMILGIVGYVAIGMVMWGGIQYVIANGDPGKVAKGKKTITNSIIGLAIVMTASIISGTIADIVSEAKKSGDQFFIGIFNQVILWAGVIAAIMIVWGGIQYITSTGNPQAVSKAKNTILYSVIGLLIVIMAAVLVNTIAGSIESGANQVNTFENRVAIEERTRAV